MKFIRDTSGGLINIAQVKRWHFRADLGKDKNAVARIFADDVLVKKFGFMRLPEPLEKPDEARHIRKVNRQSARWAKKFVTQWLAQMISRADGVILEE